MRRKRRFRTKIIFSYIFLIFFFGISLSIVYYFLTLRSLEKQTNAAIDSVKVLACVNNRLLNLNIRPLQERLILLRAQNLANDLSFMLGKIKRSSINKAASYRLVKSIIQKDEINSNLKSTGDITIINREGTIIYNTDNALIGKNYVCLEGKKNGRCSLIASALNENEDKVLHKYERADGAEKKAIDRYFTAIHIHKTHLLLFYASNVTTMFAKAQSFIFEAENREISLLTQKLKNSNFEFAVIVGICFPIILIFFILLSVVVGIKLAHRISRPVVELQEGVTDIGKGDFNVKVDEKYGTLEVVNLAKTFNKLGADLKKYITSLEKEIKARNAIESEIKIAQSIQKSVLPKFTEDFRSLYFSLHAKLKPAKNIAGDFFDFFFLDKQKTKLAFLVADVSGKGVPAAFFMGIVKTLIKQISLSEVYDNPGQMLTDVNKHLCGGNKEFMFVTVFFVEYDITTGNLRYANAGHHGAIKIKDTGKIETFGELNNLVLGFADDYEYTFENESLDTDEKLVLYTDGITEAESAKGAVYGNDHLEEAIVKNLSLSITDVCENIIKEVSEFQNNELSDDITMLVFERRG